MLIAIFFVLSFVYGVKAESDWTEWSTEHTTMHFDRSTTADFSSTTTTCEYLPYFHYFQAILNSSALTLKEKYPTDHQFYLDLAENIINLYRDLPLHRKPMMVNNTVHSLVHPLAFGIPEEFIQHSVPSKFKSFGHVVPGTRLL